MRLLKKGWWLLLTVIISIIIFDIQEFIQPFKDVVVNIKVGMWFHRFSTTNLVIIEKFYSEIADFFYRVYLFFDKFNLPLFLINTINSIMDFMIYTINYGFNVLIWFYVAFDIFLDKEVKTIKTTYFALLFNVGINRIVKSIRYVNRFLNNLWRNHKSKILISLSIVLFAKGILMTLVFEILLFIYFYVLYTSKLKFVSIFYDIAKSIIIIFTIYIPLPVTILATIIIFFKVAVAQARARLDHNYASMLTFLKYELNSFIKVINGVPNVGKTRLMTSMGLVQEEIYKQELEELMMNIENNYPEENWGEYDLTVLAKNPDAKIDFNYLNEKYPEYLHYGILLYLRGSMIASIPYAVNDPHSDSYSVIGDWEWFRPSKSIKDSPLQEYTIYLISEVDKEYNSHDNKEQVGEDGFHLSMGTGSHQTNRKSCIFLDWQIDTQVPLRIRGNAEWFLHVVDSEYKYPLLLSLYKKPFEMVYSWVDNILKQYSYDKPRLQKYTSRYFNSIRKRFDYTLVYAILRQLHYGLSNILGWFSLFGFMRFNCEMKQFDQNKVYRKLKLYINSYDETWRGQRLYNSVFLKDAYDHKNKDSYATKPSWANLPRWSSLNPTIDELKLLNSRFIEKAFFKTSDVTSESASSTDSSEQPVF